VVGFGSSKLLDVVNDEYAADELIYDSLDGLGGTSAVSAQDQELGQLLEAVELHV
jgi:hypothetical protein